jgi:hypothetical protein
VSAVNPWAEALDAVWGELTAEQIANLTPEVVALCRANHNALWHDDTPQFHEHHFDVDGICRCGHDAWYVPAKPDPGASS